MTSLHDRPPPTEAPPGLPLWPSHFCADCIDRVCTKAEHIGLTDDHAPEVDR